MIETCADVNVYLVNNITCPTSYVKSKRNEFKAYDLPEPRPPVTTKYRDSDLNNGTYFLFSFITRILQYL